MSTVITNAFRLHAEKADDVEKFHEKLRAMLIGYQTKSIFSNIAEQFVKYHIDYLGTDIDMRVKQEDKTFDTFLDYELLFTHDKSDADIIMASMNRLRNYSENFMSLYKELIRICGERNLSYKMNANITVYFKSVGEYTYYIFFARDHSIVEQLRKNINDLGMNGKFETYDYWDNTDGPDNMSYLSWKRRGRKWDKIFSSSSTPRECMNQMEIAPLTYMLQIKDVLNYIPDDYSLLKRYFFENVVEKYCEEEINARKKEGLPEQSNKCVRAAEQRAKREIEDGSFLSYKDEFMKKGFSKESLISKLLSEKVKITDKDKKSED